jgi:hypothetical protein
MYFLIKESVAKAEKEGKDIDDRDVPIPISRSKSSIVFRYSFPVVEFYKYEA